MYSTLDNIRESLKLAWKHKILWIFALMLAASAGGGGGGGLSQEEETTPEDLFENRRNFQNYEYEVNFDVKNNIIGQLYALNKNQEIQDLTGENNTIASLFEGVVKGASISPYYDRYEDTPGSMLDNELNYISIFLKKYIFNLILIGISLLIALSFGIAVGILVNSWGRGALISGTFSAIRTEELKMKHLGSEGMKYMVRIFKISLLASLIFLVSLLVAIVLSVVAFYVNIILGVALSAIFLAILILIAINIDMGTKYAFREVVSLDIQAKEAFSSGMKHVRNNLLNSYKLAVGNCLVVMFIMGAIVGSAALLLVGIFTGNNITEGGWLHPFLIVMILIFSVPSLIILILLMQAVSAYVTTYREFTWSNLFMHIKNKKPVEEVVSNGN